MKLDQTFWIGVGTGVVAVWAYHHFVKPMPGGKNGKASS